MYVEKLIRCEVRLNNTLLDIYLKTTLTHKILTVIKRILVTIYKIRDTAECHLCGCDRLRPVRKFIKTGSIQQLVRQSPTNCEILNKWCFVSFGMRREALYAIAAVEGSSTDWIRHETDAQMIVVFVALCAI